MQTGDILLIPFPFTEHTGVKKIRPSVVVCETADIYKDIVVCAISSVVPTELTKNELVLIPDRTNNLRKISVVKIDRIVTVKNKDVINKLGRLSPNDLAYFTTQFKELV